MKTIDKIVIENIRRLLDEKGMSQVDLASAAGKPASQISKLMTGASRPGDILLEALAPHLGVEVYELYQAPAKPAPVNSTQIFEYIKKLEDRINSMSKADQAVIDAWGMLSEKNRTNIRESILHLAGVQAKEKKSVP